LLANSCVLSLRLRSELPMSIGFKKNSVCQPPPLLLGFPDFPPTFFHSSLPTCCPGWNWGSNPGTFLSQRSLLGVNSFQFLLFFPSGPTDRHTKFPLPTFEDFLVSLWNFLGRHMLVSFSVALQNLFRIASGDRC